MRNKNVPAFILMAITAGLSKVCSDYQNQGGVKALYVANAEDITTFTATTRDYSAATMVTAKVWYQIAAEDFTIKADWDKKAKDKLNYVETSIELYIPKFSTANLTFVDNIGKACGLVFAVEFFNGSKILLGWDEKVKAAGALYLADTKGEGGASTEDKQGTTLKLVGRQIETPYTYSFTPALT